MFYKSVLGILRTDTNPYLKLKEVRNVLVSLQYFMVPYIAHIMKNVCCIHCFKAFIKCHINFSKGMSNNIVKDSTIQENYAML